MKQHERGSIALIIIASITSISLATFLTMNYAKQTKNNVNESREKRSTESANTENLSNLAIVKSHLTERRTNVPNLYEPAIFPNNYFANDWVLSHNDLVGIKHVELNASKIVIRAIEPTLLTKSAINDIFNQKRNQTSLFQTSRALQITKLNRDVNHPLYIASVDVMAKTLGNSDGSLSARAVTSEGRINLSAPKPTAVQVLIRKEGATNFTSEFGSAAKPLSQGKYSFQVKAKGVVHYAVFSSEGVREVLGIDEAGNMNHQANNIHAESVIGVTKAYEFGASMSDEQDHISKVGCTFDVSGHLSQTALAPEINLTVKVFGVDGMEAEFLRLSQPVFIEATPSTPTQPLTTVCQNACSADDAYQIYDSQANLALALDRALVPGAKGNDIFEAQKTGIGKGIICANYELTSAEIYKKTKMLPSELHKSNPTLYASVLEDAMKLKQFVTYMAPSCKRETIGLRDACGCFADDTLITMGDKSVKRVSDIRAGNLVWNPRTLRSQIVKRVIAGPEKPALVEIVTRDSVLKVTSQHPFLTKRGLIPASSLDLDDKILDGRDQIPIRAINLLEPEHSSELPVVWNFELHGSDSDQDHYVEANGIMTGDLYLQIKLARENEKPLLNGSKD